MSYALSRTGSWDLSHTQPTNPFQGYLDSLRDQSVPEKEKWGTVADALAIGMGVVRSHERRIRQLSAENEDLKAELEPFRRQAKRQACIPRAAERIKALEVEKLKLSVEDFVKGPLAIFPGFGAEGVERTCRIACLAYEIECLEEEPELVDNPLALERTVRRKWDSARARSLAEKEEERERNAARGLSNYD